MPPTPSVTESWLALVPALSVLGVFLILALAVLFRLRREDLAKMKAGRGLFLGGTLALAFLLGAVSLFQGQAWAGEALKVVVGVFVGAGAAWAGRGETQVVTLPQMGGQPHFVRPSERPPVPTPAKPSLPLLDHEVHVVKNALNPLQEALNLTENALREGWNLATVEGGGTAFEGMLLVFTRPAEGLRRMRLVIDGHVTEVPMGA